jgi:peroxiredoxin
VQRVSFLIGPDGHVAHVWPHVAPSRHAADVLAEVRRRTDQRALTA